MPGAASADRVLKYEDHSIDGYCETTIGDDFVAIFATTSTEFDDFAGFDLWRAPAIPYEEPASITGGTDAVDAAEGDPIVITASVPVADVDGTALGVGTLTMTLTPTGESESFAEPGFGNHKSRTEGTRRFLEGTGSFILGTEQIPFPTCSGSVTDMSFFNTNPHSFVSKSSGFQMSCSWESDAYVAVLDVFTDAGGPNAGAFLGTPDRELFTNAWTGTIEVTAIDVSIELSDTEGAIERVDATATLAPVGTPVTSTLRDPKQHTKVTEQRLDPDGTAVFSTGQTLPIDDEHCQASEFDQHNIHTQPSGPKPTNRVPVNDTPGGAITLKSGSRLVTDNRGASVDAEVPITTCPEGEFDDFGRTLWYTIAGTGGEVTVDTAGSIVDTLIGVYVKDGDAYVEVGCIDDVFLDPIGTTYQAALTFGTEPGVIYYVQIGGFRQRIFFEEPPQIGQIRIAVH